MKIASVLFLVLIPLATFAQVKSGTFIVLHSSKDEIAVASDSRDIIEGKEFDDGCKVRAFGNDLIFAAAGIGGSIHTTPGLSWDSRTIARNLYLRLSREPASVPMPIRLAYAWGNEVKEKLKFEAARNTDVISSKKPGSELTSALFAGFEGNAPLIVVGAITYQSGFRGAVDTQFAIQHIYREPQTVILGGSDVAAQFGSQVEHWEKSVPFSVDPLAAWPVSAIRFGINHSPSIISDGRTVKSIGGPIDAVRLTRDGGIQWIQIKPNCQKD